MVSRARTAPSLEFALRQTSTSRCAALAIALVGGLFALPGYAQDEENRIEYPVTEFAEGAQSAAVTVGSITAGISQARRDNSTAR